MLYNGLHLFEFYFLPLIKFVSRPDDLLCGSFVAGIIGYMQGILLPFFTVELIVPDDQLSVSGSGVGTHIKTLSASLNGVFLYEDLTLCISGYFCGSEDCQMASDGIGFLDTVVLRDDGIVSHGNVGGVEQGQGFRSGSRDPAFFHQDPVMISVDMLFIVFCIIGT